jgi:hypothetical protein
MSQRLVSKVDLPDELTAKCFVYTCHTYSTLYGTRKNLVSSYRLFTCIIQFYSMTSTKSYQWALPHVFPRSDVIRNFHILFHTLCGKAAHYSPLFPHCMEYEKALISSYYHNNDRLERYYE